MYTQELAGIEHGLNRVQGHVQQVGRRACVQANLVLEGFDPIHLIDQHENRALARSDREPLELPERLRNCVEHRQHLSRGVLV
jgi:hypothetical protein